MEQPADTAMRIHLPEGTVEIPPELRVSVQRHEQHLAQLVGTLRAAGMDAALIDASVRKLVDSYREELMAAIRALVGIDPHA